MKLSDDDVVKSLLTARPGPEACPDAGLLVGWAESRLEEARRLRVEEHLSACDACREHAVMLREEVGEANAPAAPTVRGWALRLLRAPLAIAAVALLAVGTGLWATGVFTSAGTPDTEATLLATAADLLHAEPALFEGLAPVSSERLAQEGAPAQRGGIALLGLPRVFLTEARPAFAWQAAPGAERYTVQLLDAAANVVWSRLTTEPGLAWPQDEAALAPGAKYVLEVAAESALGHVEGRRGFALASAAEAERFQRGAALAQIRSGVVGDLLVAHLALARGFTLEAERAAAAFAVAQPSDLVGQRTLAYVRRMLGAP